MISVKKISDRLFYLSYIIYLTVCILNSSLYAVYFTNIIKNIIVFCIVLLLLKELIGKKIYVKEVFFLILCIVSSILIYNHLPASTILPFFLYIYTARNINFEKLLKVTAYTSSIVVLFIIFSSQIGIIQDYISTSNDRIRHYLGFRYSLNSQTYFFNISVIILYLNRNNITLKKIIGVLISNYIIFKFTNSRLCFYLLIILCILIYIISKYKSIQNFKLLWKFCLYSFMICFAFSVFCIFNYNNSNPIHRNINEFLENRLLFGKQSLNVYDINLFGNDVEFIGSGLDVYGSKSVKAYNYVDCLYLSILERYGIIFTIVFLSLIYYSMKKSYLKNDYYMLIIMCIIAFKGIIDDLEIYLYYNTFWFAISSNILVNKNKEKE